jgi:hypothetical protein
MSAAVHIVAGAVFILLVWTWPRMGDDGED